MFTEQLADFSLEWCQTLLNSPDIVDISLPTRRPAHLNPLITSTLRTETTIRAWKSLHTRDIEDATHQSRTFFLMLSLGNGLQGHKGALHGGIFGVLIDQSNHICALSVAPLSIMTAQMDLRFKKSVPVPGVVLCRSVIVRREGRRIWIRCTIEDGEGGLFCESESLWVAKGDQKL
ncbi:MAG: hypothetical protein Q9191_004463 [Dirinaria sp. TL-2023a]